MVSLWDIEHHELFGTQHILPCHHWANSSALISSLPLGRRTLIAGEAHVALVAKERKPVWANCDRLAACAGKEDNKKRIYLPD